jgi:hypothetical protein
MFTHPDLLWSQAKYRQQELIAEADRHRLLTAARRGRRARRAQADQQSTAMARGRPAGNLAVCPPRAAAPAQR